VIAKNGAIKMALSAEEGGIFVRLNEIGRLEDS
jgi:hypothetical protein